jgi:hypothetical protein
MVVIAKEISIWLSLFQNITLQNVWFISEENLTEVI